MSALEKLSAILLEYGMTDYEINMLLGRFLEEEAQDYVECMSFMKEQLSKKREVFFS